MREAPSRRCTHPVQSRGHLRTCRRAARYVVLREDRAAYCAQHLYGPLGPFAWERIIPIRRASR